MDAKLNHSDLSQLLSKEADMTLVKAEALTKNIFDLIIEGLEQDGVVKINGLGTFKITGVANRSSVNVNTGEKFEIKGHNKLTFTPADSLKDNVNLPFAMFEPVEVNAELCDEEQVEEPETDAEVADVAEENLADEVVTVAAEEAAVEEPLVEEIAEETAVAEPKPAEEVEPVVEEEPVTEEPQPAVEVETPVENTVELVVEEKTVEEAAPAVRPEPVLVRVPKKEKGIKRDAPKKEKRSLLPYYIAAVVAMLVASVYLLFNSDMDMMNGADKNASVKELVADVPVENIASQPVVQANEVIVANEVPVVEQKEEPYSFVIVEELDRLDLGGVTAADTALYIVAGELCRHKVESNETLTRIALKYYGSKKLWPYLVKHNKLARPDALRRGMEISIPMLVPAK